MSMRDRLAVIVTQLDQVSQGIKEDLRAEIPEGLVAIERLIREGYLGAGDGHECMVWRLAALGFTETLRQILEESLEDAA